MLGEGDEEAGTLLQKRPQSAQDKEPSSFACFPCSPFSPLLFVHVPCPFHLVPCLLLLVLWKRERERKDGNYMNKTLTNACQALFTWLMLIRDLLGARD